MALASFKVKPWLELIRLPNLFSVPGDPLAGMAFAAAGSALMPGKMVAAISISVLLYMAGLILNDLMDYQEDLADRPERPLPSGNVSVAAAWLLFVLTTCVALGIAWSTGRRATLFMAVILLIFISLYNLGLKNIRVLGPVSMGLCRGCSVLLGAAIFGGQVAFFEPLIYAVYTVIVYIALLTLVADYETRPRYPAGIIWLPPVTLFVGLLVVFLSMSEPSNLWLFCAVGAWSVKMNVHVTLNIRKRGRVIPPDIGGMIGALMLLQSAFLFIGDAVVAGVVIAALLPFNRLVVRRIYAS